MQTSSSTSAAATAASADASALRACSTSGCQVSKYVEVTKRKCAEFVTTPQIMQKPLVVNGKTSIFQVRGDMAKLSDIPALSAATGGTGQPIYRIKPGTHAHIVNYVFIDSSSDSLEKAKFEDQESMRIMLESHRDSAASKLLKLTAMHRGVATQSAPSATAAHAAALASAVTTPQIHPNLSIASVEGALLSSTPPSAVVQATPASITTSTAAVPSPVVASTLAPDANPDSAKTVEQLQAELRQLKSYIARHGGTAP